MGQSSKLPHAALNALTPAAAAEALAHCCGSQRWIDAMNARRPFESTPALFDAARDIWQALDREDYLEAFAQQPQIGANLSELAKRLPRDARTAAREQAKVAQADSETLQSLRDENQRYVDRFGYNFIVSSAGKSANELVQLLRERLGNDPARELKIAAEEHFKISALRLARLA